MLRKNIYLLTLVLLLITAILPSFAFASNSSALVKIGQDVIVPENELYDAVVSIGGDVLINGNIKDAVVAIGSNVQIHGPVGDAVVVIGGEVLVDSQISGDLVIIGNKAQLSANAKIQGDLVLVGVGLEKDPSAQIGGDLTEVSIDEFFVNFPNKFTLFGVSLASIIMGLIFVGSTILALLVLLVGLVFPQGLKKSSVFLLNSPWKIFFIGLLLTIFFFPISFILFITIIGIPLLLLFWLIYGTLIIWGSAVLAYFAGNKVLEVLNYKSESLPLKLIVGILLFLLISQIPIIGWISVLIVKIMALGLAVISHLGFKEA